MSVNMQFLYPYVLNKFFISILKTCDKALRHTAQLWSSFLHGLIIPCLSWVLLSRADCSCWKSRRQLNISDCSGCDRILWASKQVREKAFQKNVSLCQDVSSLLAFHTWKNVCYHEYETAYLSHTHTQNKSTQPCRNKSFFNVQHFSCFRGNRGTAVSMPPSPYRRRDRRHPIMNTQI